MIRRSKLSLAAGMVLLALVIGAWLVGSLLINRLEPLSYEEGIEHAPGRILDLPGGRVHIVERGSGPHMVLIPGTGGGTTDWNDDVIDRLAERHHVVAVDLYGWGFSERTPEARYGFQYWSDQVAAVLEHLAIERAVIVGHSLGAAVADVFAGQHPRRVTHLIISGHGEMIAPQYFLAVAPGIGELILGLQALPAKSFDPIGRERLQQAYRIKHTRHTLLKNARWTVFEGWVMFDAIPNIQAPVLQIHGTADEEIPVWAMEKTHARFPNPDKEIVLVEDSHHYVMSHSPDAYVDAIFEFLAERPPSDA